MKKVMIFSILVLLMIACSDEDTDGFSDYRTFFEPNNTFFGRDQQLPYNFYLSKGTYFGAVASVNGSMFEYPILEIGDTLGRLLVLNAWKEPDQTLEFNLIASAPPDVVQVDKTTGHIILKDPSSLVKSKNSSFEIQTETKLGKRMLSLDLNFRLEDLAGANVLYNTELSIEKFTLTYPYLESGYELGIAKASSILGSIKYLISPPHQGLKIDAESGKITVDNPKLMDWNLVKSLPFKVTAQVSHPLVETKWNYDMEGRINLVNVSSLDCTGGNGFLFSSTDNGENFKINKTDSGIEFLEATSYYSSDDYSFTLAQPKTLCTVSSWSQGDPYLTFEILDENRLVLLRNDSEAPKIIGSTSTESGSYPIYNPIVKAQMPIKLEANKKYTIRRSYEDGWDYYPATKFSYAVADQKIEFPLQFGEVTILSTSLSSNHQIIELVGIPLINLHFTE